MNKAEFGALSLALGLIAGAVSGAYAMTVIYGEPPSERIAPSERCPPPPPCEACPPAPSCPTAVPMVEMTEDDEVAPVDMPGTHEAGLPSSAVALAVKGFSREIEICRGGEASGMLVLDLTITASAGIGRISGMTEVSASGAGSASLPCLQAASHRVQFEWSSGDGKAKLRYPLSLEATPPAVP